MIIAGKTLPHFSTNGLRPFWQGSYCGHFPLIQSIFYQLKWILYTARYCTYISVYKKINWYKVDRVICVKWPLPKESPEPLFCIHWNPIFMGCLNWSQCFQWGSLVPENMFCSRGLSRKPKSAHGAFQGMFKKAPWKLMRASGPFREFQGHSRDVSEGFEGVSMGNSEVSRSFRGSRRTSDFSTHLVFL